jgi:probable HAF family extracellular repeat protein
MVHVGTLIGPNLRWTVVSAEAINDEGQIVGAAFTGGPEPHAILLTPPR